MNYRQCIDEIRDLGFSDDAEIEEFGTIVPNSITRACEELSTRYPIYGKFEFEVYSDVDGNLHVEYGDYESVTMKDDIEDNGYLYLHMPEIVDGFLEFKNVPVMFAKRYMDRDESRKKQMFSRFNDYEIETDDTIVIDVRENKGSYRVYYAKQHTRLTEDTDDDFEFELPLKAHVLIPLLSAYYVWLEDDASKASQYYNLFEQKSDAIYTEMMKPRIRVMEGGI